MSNEIMTLNPVAVDNSRSSTKIMLMKIETISLDLYSFLLTIPPLNFLQI